MMKRRIVATILIIVLAMNTCSPAFAQGEWRAEMADTPHANRHSITLTADELTGQLMPLNGDPTGMLDQGEVLTNATGIVTTQIQGTYHRNQIVSSSSLAGTSFVSISTMAKAA